MFGSSSTVTLKFPRVARRSFVSVITVAIILNVLMALVKRKDTCMISLRDDYCGGNFFSGSYEGPVQFRKNFGVLFLKLRKKNLKYGKNLCIQSCAIFRNVKI